MHGMQRAEGRYSARLIGVVAAKADCDKLKCEMADTGPPCSRCVRRGISCLIDRRNQALLEDQKSVNLNICSLSRMHKQALDSLCWPRLSSDYLSSADSV